MGIHGQLKQDSLTLPHIGLPKRCFYPSELFYFTRNSVFWSCAEYGCNDTGLICIFHMGPQRRVSDWQRIIEEYSERRFTYLSDKLVALEGIKEAFERNRPSDSYCFGHWQSHMPLDLLWEARSAADRDRMLLNVPSWSWASITGAVQFSLLMNPSYNKEAGLEVVCKVLSMPTLNEHRLILEAKLAGAASLEMQMRSAPRLSFFEAHFDDGSIDANSRHKKESQGTDWTHALPVAMTDFIHTEKDGLRVTSHMLLLQINPNCANTYSRVGMVLMSLNHDFFEGQPMQQVTLI